MGCENPVFDFMKMTEDGYSDLKVKNGWGLTLEEFRYAQKKALKPLTLTEAYILDSLWSDHCSYKHSKNKLKELIRDNSYVFAGKESDAGAVEILKTGYCAVFKIESHNHPTLINPFDGAATGVGGVLRDIFAMGAKNIGVGASLRFGPKEEKDSPDLLQEAMAGAAFYGKNMSVPLIDLDIYYDETFKHNCLMNVSALGIVNKKDLIPNVVTKKSVGYNLIYVGKATAGAAVGGASFASQSFESGKKREIEFGSNPNLEKATFDVFEEVIKQLKKKKLFSEISFKDMGAAGLTCSTAEQTSPRGLGIEIDTRKVPVPAGTKVHPLALAVGEDQERNMIIASEKATKIILDIFDKNKPFKKHGGKTAVIGKVLKEDRFVMKAGKLVYCDIPVSLITGAPAISSKSRKPSIETAEFRVKRPVSLKKEFLKMISSRNVNSMGNVLSILNSHKPTHLIHAPGETDVPVIAPFKDEKVDAETKKTGISLVFGGKSSYGKGGSSREQAYLATVAARLKLAVSGLKPIAAADGCNYGNPDNPEHYYSFSKGIDGLNDACKIPLYKEKTPLAVIAGNVSLKNTYIKNKVEKPIDPSMIPVVFGVIKDYTKAVTTGFKAPGNLIFLVGERRHDFKGSEYARLNKKVGKTVSKLKAETAGNWEYAALEAAGKGFVCSSSVIGNGGLAGTLARMMLLGKEDIGAGIELEKTGKIREDYLLFSESAGYLIESKRSDEKRLRNIYKKYGIRLIEIGTTQPGRFSLYNKGNELFNISISELKKYWSAK